MVSPSHLHDGDDRPAPPLIRLWLYYDIALARSLTQLKAGIEGEGLHPNNAGYKQTRSRSFAVA